MKSRVLTIVVAVVVLGIVAASLCAIADSAQTGCTMGGSCGGACGSAAGGCAMKNGVCSMKSGGCAMKGAAGLSPVMTRGYSGGVLKLRVMPKCGHVMLSVLGQADRPAPGAAVSARLINASGRHDVNFKRVAQGMFVAQPDLSTPGRLEVSVGGGGAMTDVVSFDLAAGGVCGANCACHKGAAASNGACKCGGGCKCALPCKCKH